MKEGLLKAGRLSVAMLIGASMIAGCTSGSDSAKESTSNGAAGSGTGDGLVQTEQKPTEISIMVGFDGVEFPQPGNEVLVMIEEYTNTKLDIRALPGGTLHEMLPVMIASGDMANVVSFGGSQISRAYMQDAFKGGVFWDIAPHISDSTNLSQINPMVFDTYIMNGQIFGLPKLRPIARTGWVYRKDWADHLGLEEPETVEELYEFLKAFAKNDPNESGKNDTYGLTTGPAGANFSVIFGAPNAWDVQDGRFIRQETTEEHLEGLKFYKRLVEEGIMHPETMIMDRAQFEELFFSGKAGVYLNISNYMGYEARVQQSNPSAELAAFSVVEGPKGMRSMGGTGHNGIMVMPKSSVKTEEHLKNILNFFDRLADTEMSNLLYYGIEGKHYTIENDLVVRIPEMTQDFSDKISMPYAAPIAAIMPLTNARPAKLTDAEATEIRLNSLNEQYAVPNLGLNLESQTSIDQGPILDQILTDAEQKFVLGAIDEEGYRKEIQRWRDSGGDKVAEELAASYAENRK